MNGEKFYCTGALFAHIVPVLASGPGDKAYVAYVPRDPEGFTVVDDDWAGMGQRTTAGGTGRLDNVRVPRQAVVARDPLFAGPQTYGAFAQLLHTAIDVGIARGVLSEPVTFVRTRSRPWFEAGVERAADDPLLTQRVGELAIAVRAAEALLAEAGRSLDAAEAARQGGRMAGDAAAETSIAVATAKAFADRVSVDTASALSGRSPPRWSSCAWCISAAVAGGRTRSPTPPIRTPRSEDAGRRPAPPDA